MADSASLMELHAMLVEACKGYDEALQDSEKPQPKAFLEKALALHKKAHIEVQAILRARAANPDYEASFLLPVHEFAHTGAALMGSSNGFLSSFGSREERIVESYDKAIDANSDDGGVRDVLEKQKSGVVALVGETEVQ